MEFVYKVDHVYEVDDIEEVKFIGVFSSIEKAREAVNELILQPGFKDHPTDAFQINKIKIDRIGWVEGFCSWKEAIDSDEIEQE